MNIANPVKHYLLPGAGFVAFVIAVVWINANVHVDYPFHVWRMDLDDALANVAIIAGATAGIWKIKKDTDRADAKAEHAKVQADAAAAKADQLEQSFNGGMAEVAREHMQESELMTNVMVRLDRMERERDDCVGKLDSLQKWVIARLDEAGFGRREARDVPDNPV